MKDDLYYIKKKYGEKMAHLCRKMFPTILEENGKLFSLLKEHFDYNRDLCDDIINNELEPSFYSYIMSLYTPQTKENVEINKTPFELMNEAGYDLYKCETYEDTLKFKKYYHKGEELCTFTDKDRVNNYDVFFAVKKDVKRIKRKYFTKPQRQDRYGTSVISIQISKSSKFLSIKNRYNHTVYNPDATFSNNLNNIIYGLQESFNKHYNYDIEAKPLEMPNWVYYNDKFYHYSLEYGNIYYCSNNTIIDTNANKIVTYDPSRYLLFEKFILDNKEKVITMHESNAHFEGFLESIPEINSIEIKNDKNNNKKIVLINKDIEIDIDNNANIIGYKNNIVESIEDDFLQYSPKVKYIEMNNVQNIGGYFLYRSHEITDVNLESVKEVGDGFLYNGRNLERINLPNLKIAGDDFLTHSYNLKDMNFSALESVGKNFLAYAYKIVKLSLPNLVFAGNNFMRQNSGINEVYLPKLEIVGFDFLLGNDDLEKIYFPSLIEAGSEFISCNRKINSCIMPNLESAGDSFLSYNEALTKICLPKLEAVGDYFLQNNTSLKYLILPNLKYADDHFLASNTELIISYLPQLKEENNNLYETDKVLNKRI